jgi:hypothetical protein
MPTPNAGLNRNWVGVELDDAPNRKAFRRALMRARRKFERGERRDASVLTPYWPCAFADWLVYDCALAVCGCVCVERGEETCEFEVEASGCQTEGICVCATFVVPTREFTRRQLEEIVPACGEYYPKRRKRVAVVDGKPVWGVSFGPFDFPDRYCTRLEWWYDPYYDEVGREDE